MRFVVLLLSCVVLVISVLTSLPELPARIAAHYGVSGEPNGWMTKDQYATFFLAFGFGLPFFILALSGRGSTSPDRLNVPNASYWRSPENFSRAKEIIRTWTVWFAALMILFFAGLSRTLVEANKVSPAHLSESSLGWLTGSFVLCLFGLLYALNRSFKNVG